MSLAGAKMATVETPACHSTEGVPKVRCRHSSDTMQKGSPDRCPLLQDVLQEYIDVRLTVTHSAIWKTNAK